MLDKTLSPSEHDLLEQLQEKLEMKLDHLPDGVMKHSILVAEYLKEKDCSQDHVSTALCYTFLKYIETTEEERLEFCHRKNYDSLELLLKSQRPEPGAYFKLLENDELASTIIIADRILYYRICYDPDLESFGQGMKISKDYCLNLSKHTRFYNDMIEAFEIAEQHYELEIKKLIVLTNLMLYPIEEGLTCDHIIEGKLKNHLTESLSCGLLADDFSVVASENIDEIKISLLLFPAGPMNIYEDEDYYEKNKKINLKSKHFGPRLHATLSNTSVIPSDYALLTGVIRYVYEREFTEIVDQWTIPIDIETEHFVASIILADGEEVPKIGNVVSAVYKLCGVLAE